METLGPAITPLLMQTHHLQKNCSLVKVDIARREEKHRPHWTLLPPSSPPTHSGESTVSGFLFFRMEAKAISTALYFCS